MKRIDDETKQKAIKMYRKGELKIVEISNLLDISVPKLNAIYHECFNNGTLQPRQIYNIKKPKFTPEQEREIAIDYYVNDLSHTEIQKKYNAHPMQIQRIRKRYSSIYGQKQSRSPIKRRNRENSAI